MNNQPIGIFDSGIGGLTIWQEIVQQLPQESTIFVADSAYCPYGEKSTSQIYARSKKIMQFLLSQNVKLIVIACNTVTVTAIDALRREFPQIPLVGIVPVVKTAVEKSKNKHIGILSTIPTAESMYQRELIEKFAKGYVVINRGTNSLVPFVERGELSGANLTSVLREELQPFQESNSDVLALGCSHFPFLKKEMQRIVGEHVLLLDSSGAIVRQVERILTHNDLRASSKPSHVLLTTGEKNFFTSVVKRVLPIITVDFVVKHLRILDD